MKVDLSKHQREKEIAPEDAPYAYKFILDNYWRYFSLQTSHDMHGFKLLGAFVFISIWFLHRQGNGAAFDYRIGVFIAGVGTLIACGILIKMGFEYDRQLSYYVSRGKRLEENCQSLTYSNQCSIFHSFRSTWYKTSASARLCSPIFIWICTAAAGISLSLEIGFWLTVAVAAFFAAVLITGLIFYFKTARKWQLEEVNLESPEDL